MNEQEIIKFWFEELEPKQHWVKDASLDAMIEQRFGDIHRIAAQGECWMWRETPEGRLAEIIVLDQFSRNIYRDQQESFQFDGMALVLAQEAIRVKADVRLPVEQRAFVYMPFMHSESLAIHREALVLFDQSGMEHNLDFEHKHLAIIERFGRYPHRNEILGRVSTDEEIDFLAGPGSSF